MRISPLQMSIPEPLTSKLQANSALHGAVLQTLARFSPWIESSGTPFFPEYTDHGPRHIAETMETASSLIRDEAWPVVTPNDAGVLVLAVLLHDSAMHLTEDGFLSLIKGKAADRQLQNWSEPSWEEMWLEFLGEASRFDARRLVGIFGSPEPVRNPPPDPRDWTLRDRQLIGEFIRRHHPRLAHETALNGIPGPPSQPNLTLEGIDADLAELAGLVARSHGMALRDAIPHLQPYHVREYKGVHPPFLMALLRVADYIQVQSTRAPSEILRVRELRSPISQKEWKAHSAIRDIRNTHEDPEALFIDAAPENVATFLHLKKLLAGIQCELDSSWAVLGEVYGRFKGLDQLGLNLRRVRSNIDDASEFARSVPYVPQEMSFGSAGADLLKLLIGPLYGDHPETGIRELVQNAVDACRELQDYCTQRGHGQNPSSTGHSEVLVSLTDVAGKGRWLEIADSGIGMTADIIKGYFLKAGASFRRSDAWRRLHEDFPNKSRVLRSGRFGIGVLASFLVGDEVEVTTRHVSASENRGLQFSGTIDMEDIEIVYCSRSVGTTIRIRINDDEVWNRLGDARTKT